MRLLLSNDDGIDADGIRVLADVLSSLGEVYVVAPESEQSAQSHAFTLHKPLRAKRRKERWWAISGTPADCIYLGVHNLMPEPPDLVVTGINRGANLGSDVFYSGTVAGAMEAVLNDLPAVAVSLDRRPGEKMMHWLTAAEVAKRVVKSALERPLPTGVFLNVNVPNVLPDALGGLAVTRLGRRRYTKRVDARKDPWGRNYYWIGGEHELFAPDEGTDGVAIEQGYATVTPMHADMTRPAAIPDIEARFT